MRRWLDNLSIGSKVTITILATTAAALLVIGGWGIWYGRSEGRQSLVQQMTTLAEVVGSNSTAALLFDDRDAAAEILAALDAVEGASHVSLYRPDGTLFASRDLADHAHEPPQTRELSDPARGTFHRFGEEHLTLVHPIRMDEDHLGTLVLKLELGGLWRWTRWFTLLIGMVLLAALGSAYAVSLRLRRWITRPIQDLAEVARKVSLYRDYSIRASKHGEDELGRLVDGFNEMLAQIERRDEELLQHRDHLEELLEERLAQLRERESQLRQAQKMEAVGRLAGGIAHDFNNLLTAISGYAQLVRGEMDDGDQAGEDVDEILRAAKQASALTGQLLAFSRKQVLAPEVMDVNQAIREVETMLQRLIGEHIRMTVDLDPELVPVESDPAQMQQVILNLVVNSRDAMPEGGTLEIRTRNLEPSDSELGLPEDLEPGRYAVVEVEDDGPGMDDETRARAFEPFFTTKDLDEGTGLGLATVYGIVTQSGGHVELESSPGEGTTARIFLPEASAEKLERPAEAPDPEAIEGSETILVVEDEDAVRNLVERVLTRRGYRVLAADGPAAALEQWRRHGDGVDLLLSDVVMPEMSGPALARQIAGDGEHPELRVVFMSGYPDRAGPVQAELDPETLLLRKPFSGEQLLRRVREALAGTDVGR